jgi:hypothetical protein
LRSALGAAGEGQELGGRVDEHAVSFQGSGFSGLF